MRGLIEKDIHLMKQRKTTIIIFVGLAFIMSLSMDSSFLISYFSMMGCVFAISTISYDEFENGMSFLMTLPITPRLYVIEKYVFSAINMTLFAVFAILIQSITNTIQHAPFVLSDMLLSIALYLPIFLVILGFYIPVHLKFGAEKSRLALFSICGVVFVLGALGKKVVESMSLEKRQGLIDLLTRLQEIPLAVIISVSAVVFVLILSLSILISIRIMQNKEY